MYGTQAGSLAFMDLIIDTSSGGVHFNGVGTTTDPACYDMTAMLWNSSANQNYFSFGGPGGNAAGCN